MRKKRLVEGVSLEDGVAIGSPIEAGGGEGVNCWYRVTDRGRNRAKLDACSRSAMLLAV
jgi:23S rRNA pseudouridine2605 synthase